MRLNRFLAAAGVASRRKCDEIIKKGLVSVNGVKGDYTGYTVDLKKDIVEYGGCIIKPPKEKAYIMLNKPAGYICTSSDEKGRDTVFKLIKEDIRLFTVGRLDFDTEGLLILTNDGELSYRLTHPKHNVEKTYFAVVSGNLTEDRLSKLKNGVMLDGKKTSPAKVKVLEKDDKKARLNITIREGRNRQVRRMTEELGMEALYLKRVSIGGLSLGDLQTGEYRNLSKKEVEYLYSL